MGQVDTNGGKRQRKRWPEALKREIVAASYAAGASVSMVARRYDVNANQVFSWRRRYRDTDEQWASPSSSPTPAMVPVTITSEPAQARAAASAPPVPPAPETIEIEVSGVYRIRVGAGFDGRTLQRVLDVLRKR